MPPATHAPPPQKREQEQKQIQKQKTNKIHMTEQKQKRIWETQLELQSPAGGGGVLDLCQKGPGLRIVFHQISMLFN